MKITKILNNINNSIWENPYRNIRSSGFYGHIYDYLHTVGKDLHSKYSNLYDAPWIAVKEFTSYNNGKVVLLKLFFRAQEYNKNYNVLSYETFLGSFYGTMFWLMNLLTLSTTYYKELGDRYYRFIIDYTIFDPMYPEKKYRIHTVYRWSKLEDPVIIPQKEIDKFIKSLKQQVPKGFNPTNAVITNCSIRLVDITTSKKG